LVYNGVIRVDIEPIEPVTAPQQQPVTLTKIIQ
jgi:hypothetical protein